MAEQDRSPWTLGIGGGEDEDGGLHGAVSD